MKFQLTLFCISFCSLLFAQVPQGINYQAIVRDGAGVPITVGPVSIDVTMSNGSGNFTETHSETPNQFGLVSFVIGSINTTGFAAFDFSVIPTTISIDAAGNTLGTQTLQSVPFSLRTAVADSVKGVDLSSVGTTIWTENGSDINFTTGNVGVGTASVDPKAELYVTNIARVSSGYFGNVNSSIPSFGLMHANLVLDNPAMHALLQDKSGGVQLNSYNESLIPKLRLQNNGIDQAVVTYQGDLSDLYNGVVRIKGVVDNKFQPAGALEFEHTYSGTPYVSSQISGTVGTDQDMGELRFSVMDNGALKEAMLLDEQGVVHLGGYTGATERMLVVDAAGVVQTSTVPAGGDITAVTAGSGLIGGGATGAVTLNVVGTNGLTTNTNDFRLGGALIQNTVITQGAFSFDINLSGTGDFAIQDNGTDVLLVSDNGTVKVKNDISAKGMLLFSAHSEEITVTGTASYVDYFGLSSVASNVLMGSVPIYIPENTKTLMIKFKAFNSGIANAMQLFCRVSGVNSTVFSVPTALTISSELTLDVTGNTGWQELDLMVNKLAAGAFGVYIKSYSVYVKD